jgi:hypothetical protein
MLIRKEIGYWSCWNPEPYSGSRSHRSQGEEKGTGSRPLMNSTHHELCLRAVCLSTFSVRNTSVIRYKSGTEVG